MAKFDDHILQAKRNLSFLQSINTSLKDCYDWQVTVSFYAALHLVNAHLSRHNLQYRKHKDVNHALNFSNQLSAARLPEDEYISYTALQSLSRRSRYLVNEKGDNLDTDRAFLTYDKHVSRAFRHLNRLITHFCDVLHVEFDGVDVICSEVKQGELKYLRIKKPASV